MRVNPSQCEDNYSTHIEQYEVGTVAVELLRLEGLGGAAAHRGPSSLYQW